MNKTYIWTAIALAAVACYQSLAMRQAATSRPAIVVWIDIERVFAGLNARARADQELNELNESLKAQNEVRRAAISDKREELEVLSKGTAAYKSAEEALLQMTLEYQGYQEFAQRKLEVNQARVLGKIYDEIRKGAKKLAEEQGFDYVCVNDSLGELRASNQDEMNRQISARRVIYATDQFDATDMLIAIMNRP